MKALLRSQSEFVKAALLLVFSGMVILIASNLARTFDLPRVFSPTIVVASLAYFLMLAGFAVRRHSRNWHARLMLTAMSIDLALVIFLQVQKGVIQTAVGEALGLLARVHIGSSLAATALYIPMLYLGFRLLSDNPLKMRQLHKRIGIAAFTLRTIGFFTMFSMLAERS